MSTTEKRDRMRSQRYTKTEDDLMLQQAAAEGYSSVIEWQRDTLIQAAKGRSLARSELEAVTAEARTGFTTLAEQISTGTTKQVQRGIDEIGASVRSSVATAVQDVTAREVKKSVGDLPLVMRPFIEQVAQEAALGAVQAAMAKVVQSQENFRVEIRDYLQGLINLMTGAAPSVEHTGGYNHPARGEQATPEERQAEWMK
ncbi:TPA: hypothetical protein QDB01_000296 [Burkholderia vietnamiensis]|nr:hypothetical protein [Burkholderia vietnamiensis]